MPWPISTEAPSTVEVTLARTGSSRIVHFVNATGQTPLQETIPVDVGMTRVRLGPGERCGGVHTILTDNDLDVKQDGEVVSFSLGRLGSYEAVVLTVQ